MKLKFIVRPRRRIYEQSECIGFYDLPVVSWYFDSYRDFLKYLDSLSGDVEYQVIDIFPINDEDLILC